MAVETGAEAPDFTLKDQEGNEVTFASDDLGTARTKERYEEALAKL